MSSARDSAPLRIAQKMEIAIEYAYHALRDFPKSERHGLSAEIRATQWRVLREIIHTAKRDKKRAALYAIDAELELLRRQIRMAATLGFLAFRRYENWSRHLDEVGAMLGAWIKKEQGGRH